MKVLIFGASGFLGSQLVRTLRSAGHTTTCVVRQKGQVPGEIVVHDLAHDGGLPAVKPHDGVVYLAQSRTYGRGPEGVSDLFGVNLMGLIRALELARRANASRFVFASTGSVYGLSRDPLDETSPLLGADLYALSKRAGEQFLAEYAKDLSVAVLRLFALYGPGQRNRMVPNIVAKVAAREPVLLQPLEAGNPRPHGFLTTPCFVADAATVLQRILEDGYRGTLNVAGPDPVSVRDIAERAASLLNQPVAYEVAEKPRAGDLIANIDRMRSIWSGPYTHFEDGLAQTIAEDFEHAR